MNVISWCFFVNRYNTSRLPEYIFGLRCNQRAASIWFPQWKLQLYIDKTVSHSCPEVFQYITEICNEEPKIDIIECRDGFNPTVERYRPFFDSNVNICLARDIDSILSQTDAKYVEQWLNGDFGNVDILCYREYKQPSTTCMGGGIAIKPQHFLSEGGSTPFLATPYQRFTRGVDETQLEKLLEVTKSHHIVTRMTSEGIYCIPVDFEKTKAVDSQILWTIPFFDALNGYAHNYPNNDWLEYATTDKKVEFVKQLTIKDEHIDVIQHSTKIVKNDTEWIR